MVAVALELAGGGRGELVALEGEVFTLRSPAAAAPGARLTATVVADGRRLELKVQRSVRAGEAFTVRGRLVNLTRATREALLLRLGPS